MSEDMLVSLKMEQLDGDVLRKDIEQLLLKTVVILLISVIHIQIVYRDETAVNSRIIAILLDSLFTYVLPYVCG